jgi:type II secretory ATPase GspE/PulE/Tfp pilus assembly ATPase PilB-like protein
MPEEKLAARVAAILATLPHVDRDELPKNQTFYTSPGCEACQQLQYRGQIGIYEVLLVDADIENAILSGAELSESAVLTMARKNGMRTMVEDGVLKALQGITSLEEVFRVTSEEG